MSYDVSFRRNVENMEGELYLNESYNMTSNVNPMYHAAGLGLGDPDFWIGYLDKKSTKEVAAILIPVYGWLVAHPDEMRELEPKNGWGSYETALQFLREIYDTCLDHPECFLEVSV
jgi:hypothetical protein